MMTKNIFHTVLKRLAVTVIAFFVMCIPAVAAEYGWQITSFHTDMTINQDTTIKVQETIDVDFFATEKRGILREIPVEYTGKDGQKLSIHLNVKSVRDREGNDWEYTTYRSGNLLVIRIGNPEIYLSGSQNYVIEYTADRTYNYFPATDSVEYFWNVTGTWPVAIKAASITMQYPGEMDGFQRANCFTGPTGSYDQNCTVDKSGNAVTFASDQELMEGEQFSTAIQVQSGSFVLPGFFHELLWWLEYNWVVLIPLFLMGLIVVLWFVYGKEHGRAVMIPVWYPPMDMDPMAVGVLYDDVNNSKELTAGLLYLAEQGYMSITKTGNKHYSFTKLGKPKGLPGSLQYMWDSLWSGKQVVTTDDLKESFYVHIPVIKRKVFAEMMEKELYYKSPEDVIGTYVGLGFLILVGGVIFAGAMEHGMALLSFVVAGCMWIGFGMVMPKKTIKGLKAFGEAKGMREFIYRAERYMLEFTNAPAKEPKTFERLLPYAVALGVEKEWVKMFKEILRELPAWLQGNVEMSSLGRELSTFQSIATSALTSAPAPKSTSGSSSWSSYSSSGGSSFSGGSSGGGFGGGGGGSW